jgi:hypothetical protein
MELTGIAKEDFKNWFLKQYELKESEPKVFELDEATKDALMEHFYYGISEAMQWGEFVDFFDSKGFYITIQKADLPAKDYFYWMINDMEYYNSFDKRPEARVAAIEEANNIYNNKNNG